MNLQQLNILREADVFDAAAAVKQSVTKLQETVGFSASSMRAAEGLKNLAGSGKNVAGKAPGRHTLTRWLKAIALKGARKLGASNKTIHNFPHPRRMVTQHVGEQLGKSAVEIADNAANHVKDTAASRIGPVADTLHIVNKHKGKIAAGVLGLGAATGLGSVALVHQLIKRHGVGNAERLRQMVSGAIKSHHAGTLQGRAEQLIAKHPKKLAAAVGLAGVAHLVHRRKKIREAEAFNKTAYLGHLATKAVKPWNSPLGVSSHEELLAHQHAPFVKAAALAAGIGIALHHGAKKGHAAIKAHQARELARSKTLRGRAEKLGRGVKSLAYHHGEKVLIPATLAAGAYGTYRGIKHLRDKRHKNARKWAGRTAKVAGAAGALGLAHHAGSRVGFNKGFSVGMTDSSHLHHLLTTEQRGQMYAKHLGTLASGAMLGYRLAHL